MILSLIRKTNNFVSKQNKLFFNNFLNISNSKTSSLKLIFRFASKKKRIIELRSSTIKLDHKIQSSSQILQRNSKYLQLRKKLQTIPWQQISFDQLCSLDQQMIDLIEIQVKKSKFNISDEQFLSNNNINRKLSLAKYSDLDRYYKKVYSILKNTNDYYDEFQLTQTIKKGYLNQIYITDLKKDKQLNDTIARFIKNINKPQKLQAIAQPTFVKHLLSLKRQLMLLGVHFQTKAQKKQTLQKKQKIIESNQIEQLPEIEILEILNYQYEFWQDVKHNRAKNGNQDNFFIQTKQIQNPNQSILLKEIYPTIKVCYIAKKKKDRQTIRNFCIKADLLIQINKKMKRKIKIQWQGPSSKKIPKQMFKTINQNEQQLKLQKVNYLVIDYENIYNGNPTIKQIFSF